MRTSFFTIFFTFVIFLFSFSLFAQTPSRSIDFKPGANTYIQLGTEADFGTHIGANFTFEAWVKNEGSGTWARIFDFGDNTSSYMFLTTANGLNGKMRVGLKPLNQVERTLEGPVFPLNKWVHVAVTFAGNQCTIYLNGSQVATANLTVNPSSLLSPANNLIGDSQFSADPIFNGKMDEIRVWNVARSQAQIQQWKDCELSGGETGLITYLKFNTGYVNQVNNGTVMNYGNLSNEIPIMHNFPLTGLDGNFVSDDTLANNTTQNAVLELDGSDRFQLSNEQNFDFTNAYTIEGWINPTTVRPNPQVIFSKENPANTSVTPNKTFPFKVGINGTSVFLENKMPNLTGSLTATNTITYDKWQHIACVVYKENNLLKREIYVNGVLSAQNSTPYTGDLPTNDEQAYIALGIQGQSWNFHGKLSNIRFWNKRLLQSEINNFRSFEMPTGTPNLVAQYNNFSNIANGLLDNAGNNHGTINSSPTFASDPCYVAFTQHPQDMSLNNLGGNITLTANIKFCNAGNYTYQWTRNGVNISGANSLSFTVNGITANDLGLYQLNVSSCGGVVYKTKQANVTSTNQGKVLHFDGIDDHVKIPTTFNHANYTIEGKVRFDKTNMDQTIIALIDAAIGLNNFYSHVVAVNKDGYFQHTTLAGGEMQTVVNKNVVVETNRWYHFTASFQQNGSMRMKVDNIEGEVKTINNLGPATGNQFVVGQSACGFNKFNGELEELRIWNIETNTYSQQVITNASANLIHYYNFNVGIANANNNVPTPLNTMSNPFGGSMATLHNFALNGNTSNWLGCGVLDGISLSSPLPNQVLTLGETLSLTQDADNFNGTETYQWYKNVDIIPGATTKTLTIPNIQPKDFGKYYIKIGQLNACPNFSPKINVTVLGSGEVLNFDGINDHVVIRSNPSPVGAITAEFWVKFEGNSTTKQHLVTAAYDGGPNILPRWQLFTDADGKLNLSLQEYNSFEEFNLKSNSALQANTWYHIAIRSNASQPMIINGLQQSATTPPLNGPIEGITHYYIGNEAIANAGYSFPNIPLSSFKGEMDEFRLWFRDKTLSEIIATKDRELILSDNFNMLGHYLQFNQGIANGNNTNPILDLLPDGSNLGFLMLNTTKMKNFDFSGDVSNWSDCSPVTVPNASVVLNPANPYYGQRVSFYIQTIVDTATLNYQWRKNGINITGATNATYILPNYAASDIGNYDVIVSDQCSPQYIDTIAVPMITPSCYANESVIDINYPVVTEYIGCTDTLFNCLGMSGKIHYKIDGGYCNSEQAYEGGEVIYKVTLAQSQLVRLKLTELNSDVDLFVFGSSCNLDSCVGSSINDLFADESLDVSLPAGESYIIIDTKTGFGGAMNYKLTVEMFDGKCDFATPLLCDGVKVDTTSNGASFLNQYNTLTGYTGTEKIYKVVVTNQTTLLLDLTDVQNDLDLFLLDAQCKENVVLASSINLSAIDESITKAVQPGTYYVVVDGKNGATGTFKLTLDCKDYFSATVLDNDAYVDLEWSIDKTLCVPQDTGVIIKLISAPSTVLFTQEFTTAALTPEVISGTFRNYLGPNKTKNYVLRVFNRLSNQMLCQEFKTGSTLPFQAPEIISFANPQEPDSIKLIWRNHSKLSDEIRILRNGVQIANLTNGYTEDSLIVSYFDAHDINNTASIKSNTTYNYCLQTHSNQTNLNYPNVCANASTYNINFQASDNAFPDKIALTWNNLSAFCTAIKIERNGIQLAILSKTQTFYNDLSPINGINTSYSLTLLNDDVEKMEVFDNGRVAANGVISGSVVTVNGAYPIKGVTVALKKDTIIGGSPTTITKATTTTNFEGKFTFGNVVYGLSQSFKIFASKAGSNFTNNNFEVTLNSALPQKTDVVITDGVNIFTTSATNLVNNFTIQKLEAEDKLILNWAYTNQANDTLFFNIFRNGEVIASLNDASATNNQFVDLTGIPKASYNYVLKVFKISNGTSTLQELAATAVYPDITPLSGFDFIKGNTSIVSYVQDNDPRIYFDWSTYNYPSQNYHGFRIFRDGLLIGEVANGVYQFNYLSPPNTVSNYKIKAFRNIGSTTFESEPYPPLFDTVITSNPIFQPVVQILDDVIQFKITNFDPEPINYEPGFMAAAQYDGVLFERKLTSEPNSGYKKIYDLPRAAIVGYSLAEAQHIDVKYEIGVPNANYDYRVSSYIKIKDKLYFHDTVVQATFPSLQGISGYVAQENIGSVALSWGSNTMEFELIRIHDAEEDTTLLATLAKGSTSYIDFVNNPKFSVFLNNYSHVEYDYVLKPFVTIDGVRYYGTELTLQAGPVDEGSGQPLPSNVMASNDLPNHVKLCWDWTAALPAQFIIYRNDTLAIDTMPNSARAHYDYNAPKGQNIKYSVAALINGVVSPKVSAYGSIPAGTSLSGRVYNLATGAGLPNTTVTYSFVSYNVATTSVKTNETGHYVFENIPNTIGQTMYIQASNIEADFFPNDQFFANLSQTTLVQNNTGIYVKDFIDHKAVDEGNEIAQIQAMTAVADHEDMKVKINWAPTNSNYDGFQVFRSNRLIGEVVSGQAFAFVDSSGFNNTVYAYSVRAYINGVSGRTYSSFAVRSAEYPGILPIENLTVTSYTEMNRMLVAWSHPLDNHDTYRVRRNGQFMTSIPTGQPMMWYDTTGIPGINYLYEVVAIKGIFASTPVFKDTKYKGVAEVKNLATFIPIIPTCSNNITNENYVNISWSYTPQAAQGFEIYRDNVMIAEIEGTTLKYDKLPLQAGDVMMTGSTAFFKDYEGKPGTLHKYHVLAFVNREGSRYTSGFEELFLSKTITYPVLADVTNLQVGPNNVLGSARLTFQYTPHIATGYEVLRNGIVIDIVVNTNATQYVYEDITGLPNTNYTYKVRAYDNRNGIIYKSLASCAFTMTYPIVPTPQNVIASQGSFENRIEVTWDFDSLAYVDTFFVENITLNKTTKYTGGKRRHIDIINDFNFNKYEYRIRALRKVNASLIYSAWSPIVKGWSQRQITGNENESIGAECTSSYNGFATDIDGDWAVSGVVGGSEKIEIYRRINGGWSLYQSIESPVEVATDFGYSVAISGNRIVVGAPNNPNPLYNAIYVYTFNGNEWGYPQRILGETYSQKFGHSVDIDGDYIVASAPTSDGLKGAVKLFHYKNGAWVLTNTLISSNEFVRNLGYGLGIKNGFVATTYYFNTTSNPNTASNKVDLYKITPTNTLQFKNNAGITVNSGLSRDNVDVIEGYVAVGDAPSFGYKGSMNVITITNEQLGSSANLSPSDLVANDAFGESVSITSIPSPTNNALYVMGGTQWKTVNGLVLAGKAYMYSNQSGTWQLYKTFTEATIEQEEQFGFSSAMSKDAFIIGAIAEGLNNNGSVRIENFVVAPKVVSATDGISAENDPAKVTVEWQYHGNPNLATAFNIYRDGQFLIQRNMNTMTAVSNYLVGSWEDNNSNPGQRHVYEVKTKHANLPFESYGTTDIGYSRPDATIKGSVVTAQGGVPLPGVSIKARGIVLGEIFEYTATTLANGEYFLNNVYYDSDPNVVTTYQVTATYADHEIIPIGSPIASLLSLNNPVTAIVDFIDNTAYIIKGKISQPMTNCPLEGIKVTPIVNGTQQLLSQATTDENGNYTIIVNPQDPSLVQFKIRVENKTTINNKNLHFNFIPSADTVYTNFANFPFVTTLNFVDNLTYPISIKVKNTCNDPISAAKWKVRIRTLDGCFDQVFNTLNNGNLTTNLLPLNYVMTVVGSDVSSTVNQQALDYFANFPVNLNLQDLHIDSFATSTNAEIAAMGARQFTYHKAPTIEVNGFSQFFCNQPVAVIKQGNAYTLDFSITELFGTACPVKEGKISITNPASAQSLVTVINYDENEESFPPYTFVAGSPNQVAPHFYALIVDYLSDDDIFLGRKVVPVFVEGSIALQGTDIIVNPVDANEAVPYPVMILRDPPGDGSSSYIAGGQTISFSTSSSDKFGGSGKFSFENSFEIFELATTLNISNTLGGSTTKTNQWSNELTVSQTVSTSDGEDFVGVNADVIMGTGFVMSYGIVNEYKVGQCDTIEKTSLYRVSPETATTMWSYTIGQINDIIIGYINDSIKIENGTLKLQEGMKTLSLEEARLKNATYIKNWREVLNYHGKTTVPHFAICATDPKIVDDILLLTTAVRQAKIDEWQSYLCPVLGTGSGSTFQLKDNIVWSNSLIDLYNAASLAIGNLANNTNPSINWSYPAGGNLAAILNQPDVAAFINNYGAPIKNLTLGGGASVTQSIQNVNSSASTFSSSFTNATEVEVGFDFTQKTTNVSGGFAGVGGPGFVAGAFVGVVKEVAKTEIKLGVTATFDFELSEERSKTITNSVETGYTLADDDAGDQFSVAIIQPIAQNHTPYFQFFGGRSSCPAEDGTILLDNPKITIYDATANASSQTKSLFNVPANSAATYTVRVDNQTPVSSAPDRGVKIFLVQESNINSAVVKINGVSLNNGNLELTLPAFQPLDLSLTIERGPIFYDHPDIQIGIEPSCGGEPVEYITVSTYFSNPCSPVTIIAPDNNWVINDNTTKLTVAIQDYNPANVNLVNATLQYRRIGAGQAWTDVNPLQLENGNYITKAALAANNTQYAAGQIPKYFFIWTIPNTNAFPDGNYEVRVKMTCDNFTTTLSNVVFGKIARDGLNLFGTPQPADQIWTSGDEISFSFTKDLDCPLLDIDFIEDNIRLIDVTTGDTLAFNVSCYANKLIFTTAQPMSNFDGHFLRSEVKSIPSEAGNISAMHTWTFRVITQQIYWADADTIKIRLYRDEEQDITARLENSTINQTISGLSLLANDGMLDDWLQITNPTTQPFVVNPAGRDIEIHIDASKPLGIYNETINVAGLAGATPKLYIQLEVIDRPPHWVVDPGQYNSSMNVIANWRFTTEADSAKSTDLKDIISVWKGNEIRGVANIVRTGNFYAAYLTVYGKPGDNAVDPLEFRVWDSDAGIEYDAYPFASFGYTANTTRGNTANPEKLIVNATTDVARYIPLRQGWTGFSLNHVNSNMTVSHQFRSLKNVSENDIVMTQDKFSLYNDSLGWYNFGAFNLASFSNNVGYMIYLSQGPDTLRVSGAIASHPDIMLKNGWNWLGFPFENNELLNNVLSLNAANATGLDQIKVDFPLPGSTPQFANYDIVNDNWNNGNLTTMKSNHLYKFYSAHPNGALLTWSPTNNIREEITSGNRSNVIADPNDASTWILPTYNTDSIMPIIADVLVNNQVVTDVNDKVAFFKGNEIKGVANISYLSGINKYQLSMVAEEIGGNYDIRYFDASTNTISTATNPINFKLRGYGNIDDPLHLVFDGSTPCPQVLTLTADNSPLSGIYKAVQEIKIEGIVNILPSESVTFDAAKLTIKKPSTTNKLNAGAGANVVVKSGGCL